MDYTALASTESVQKTAEALKAHGFQPTIIENGKDALEYIKKNVPQGASIMNGSSRTLEQIGFVEYLKAGQHGWNNLHEMILAEKDAEKQKVLRRQALISDYYLGSVHALSETGEMVIASNTGSQLPHIVYSSPNVIFVVGTQKIVPTVEEGQKRLREHVVPLEDENMQQKYKMHTALNKEFIYHTENVAFTGRTVQVLLVNEKLGF
jgi:L-lactate utilization protein LutB